MSQDDAGGQEFPDGGSGDVRREMLAAIDDEIEAAEARRRVSAIPVGVGRLVKRTPDLSYYAFAAPRRRGGLKRGREIGLEAGSAAIPAVVTDLSGTVLVIALDSHFGRETPEARVIVDATWILRALQQRIRAVDPMGSAASRSPLGASSARVIGLGDLSVGTPPPTSSSVVPAGSPLNADQRRVIELAHHAPASYLWGPGGTGKTETLARLVLSLARRGQRCLLTGPTNHAVDGLVSRVLQLLQEEPWWEEGAMLRLGPKEGITLSASTRADVHLNELVRRRIGPSSADDPDAFRREARHLVDRTLVLATTVHQTYLSPQLLDSSWDILVVDEASMIAPAALFAAASLAERYVVAGDFRQLPPVAYSGSVASRAWLRRDAFEAVGIPDDIARGDFPEYLVMLREQYRMAPGICDLVAEAYEGLLRTHPSVLARAPGPLGADEVLYIDSTGSRTDFEAGSRFNRYHADLTTSLFERALERRALTPAGLRGTLVITPFVAQARVLDTELKRRFGRRRPRVRTVHQSQGREADLVVLDLVDAGNKDVSKFLGARNFASAGGRLQTVAVTRARKNLVVLGDLQHLLYEKAAGPVGRGLLKQVVATGRELPVHALLRRPRAA